MLLHVRSMTLTSDTQHPQLDVPFNVTVSIRVKERVSQLQDVYLPTFFGPEELGDVRTLQQSPSGTLYRETLTLEAHSRGPLSITPAYMDAIDAHDHKPKRFFTNSLRLNVQGGRVGDFWAPLRLVLGALAAFVGICVAIAFCFVVVLRLLQSRRTAPAEPPAVEPEVPPVSAEETLGSAVAQLRTQRSRASALGVRAALWRITGAGPGETLNDVLARSASAPEAFRYTLVSAERAAFVDEERMAAAIDELLTSLDAAVLA